MTWPRPLLSFDLETTGVDIETARIVTAALVTYVPGNGHKTRTWLSDVGGAEIPEDAARIHGIDTARARKEGSQARDVVDDLAAALHDAAQAGTPIVIMNASYDLSVLDRECRRYQLPTLTDRVGREIAPVLDPLVIDKHVDRYRKGSRKLSALAAHYGVTLTDAHSSDADALATAEVVVAMANRHQALFEDLDALHKLQTAWATEQAKSFRAYREKRGEPTDGIRDEWPLVPYCPPVPHQPARDNDFEQWLKQQRDVLLDGYGADCPPPAWHTVDALLDLYRLHADTGTPLGEHVCEAGNRDDCGHDTHPF